MLPDKPRKQRLTSPKRLQPHDVRELAPVLKDHSFTEIEMGPTEFSLMGTRFWYIRAKAV